MHICSCLDPGHNEMFRILVGELTSWLIETLGKHSIALTVEMYLLARGEAKMSSCVHGSNVDLVTLSVQTNHLGWDGFLEGCLSSHWLTVASGSPSSLAMVPIPVTTCIGMPTYFQTAQYYPQAVGVQEFLYPF
jgi:hypothetical protein